MARRWSLIELLRMVPNLLLGNLQYKVLSLIIAVSAWLWVQGEEIHQSRVRAKIEWSVNPELIALDNLPDSMTLKVEGPRAAVRRLKGDVVARADLSRKGVGEHRVQMAVLPIQNVPDDILILDVSPEELVVRLDERLERHMGVDPVVVGVPARGYAVEQVRVEPKVVAVTGPRVVLEGLHSVPSVPIDVSEISGTTVEIEVSLVLPRGVKLVEEWAGTGTVTLRNLNAVRNLAAVPVHVWQNHEWRPIDSQSTIAVSLEGPSDVLREIDLTEITVFVHLPKDLEDVPAQIALYDDGSDAHPTGPRYTILHPRSDVVSVTRAPDEIRVVRP